MEEKASTTKKYKMKSPIDSVIVDMIIDHFNKQAFSKKREQLTGKQFTEICLEEEQIYYEEIMIEKEMASA